MIPDAPYIRDAERYGMPDADYTYYCPICGAENPEWLYLNDSGDVYACDVCVDTTDALDWALAHPEDARLKEG